jgi:hypothetical protein
LRKHKTLLPFLEYVERNDDERMKEMRKEYGREIKV